MKEFCFAGKKESNLQGKVSCVREAKGESLFPI